MAYPDTIQVLYKGLARFLFQEVLEVPLAHVGDAGGVFDLDGLHVIGRDEAERLAEARLGSGLCNRCVKRLPVMRVACNTKEQLKDQFLDGAAVGRVPAPLFSDDVPNGLDGQGARLFAEQKLSIGLTCRVRHVLKYVHCRAVAAAVPG